MVGNIKYEISNTTIYAYTMLTVSLNTSFIIGTTNYTILKNSNDTRIIGVKDNSNNNVYDTLEGHKDHSYLENNVRYYVSQNIYKKQLL